MSSLAMLALAKFVLAFFVFIGAITAVIIGVSWTHRIAGEHRSIFVRRAARIASIALAVGAFIALSMMGGGGVGPDDFNTRR